MGSLIVDLDMSGIQCRSITDFTGLISDPLNQASSSPVPEPATLLLLGVGLLVLLRIKMMRRGKDHQGIAFPSY